VVVVVVGFAGVVGEWCEMMQTREKQMTTQNVFREIMRDRRIWRRGSAEYEYLTRAARKLVWIMRGIPVMEWKE
jgi:hypothetical protein